MRAFRHKGKWEDQCSDSEQVLLFWCHEAVSTLPDISLWGFSQCGDTFCPQVHCFYLQWDAFEVCIVYSHKLVKPTKKNWPPQTVPSLPALQWELQQEAGKNQGRREEICDFVSQIQRRRAHHTQSVGKQYIWYTCMLKMLGSNVSLLAYTGYVDDLFTQLWKVVGKWKSSGTAPKVTSPPPLCSKYERPDKHDAIQEHQSRFS